MSLHGHWLVADMDGTLLPTPSRAGGRYFAFHECPAAFSQPHRPYLSCLPALRRFIARGGSLCVVSTAGRRMWRQLYPDLATSLYPDQQQQQQQQQQKHHTGVGSASTKPQEPGRLLLCGFTGAAMFVSRPASTVQQMMMAAPTTSNNNNNVSIPPPEMAFEEWEAYRHGAARGGSTTTLTATAATLAMREGRNAIIRFLEHISFMSGHDPERAAPLLAGCLSRKYHEPYVELLREVLADGSVRRQQENNNNNNKVPHLCFREATALAMENLVEHGRYLVATGDALVDCQTIPTPGGQPLSEAATAQIVVMGIPMRYFDRIFFTKSNHSHNNSNKDDGEGEWQCCPACAEDGRLALERVRCEGLLLKAQPNSICVHRDGVNKASCIQWMMEQLSSEKMPRYLGLPPFDLARSLAMGDAPATVDHPMTSFAPMRFISLEPTPVASLPHHPNILHVGGEEEGAAVMLEELFHHQQQRGSGGFFDPSTLAACATTAAQRMMRD